MQKMIIQTLAFMIALTYLVGCKPKVGPPSPPAPSSLSTPIPPPEPAKLRVFVSSTRSSGSMGGLAGADAICQGLADGQNLGGTWIAWLSDSGTNAYTRMEGGPWYLIDGITLAHTKATLRSVPATAIALDETGSPPPITNMAWTGTRIGGTVNGSLPCGDWFGGGGSTSAGRITDSRGSWTNAIYTPCSNSYHLYCFEH